jgi:predicted restriction endonuclease
MTRWVSGQTFSLSEVYEFEGTLGLMFPRNAHIREKIRQTLQKLRDTGDITFLESTGSYTVNLPLGDNLFPDEVDPRPVRMEGSTIRVEVNAYERSSAARADCIRYHGCRCFVCKMSFGETYGQIGEGFIHVHHIKPLSSVAEKYAIDPVHDLVPVCPNCHAMLHRQSPPLTVEELRKRLK